MKKLIGVLSAFAIMISLCACENGIKRSAYYSTTDTDIILETESELATEMDTATDTDKGIPSIELNDIPGKYYFGTDGYYVNIEETPRYAPETPYYASVVFSVNDKDYISGLMNINTIYEYSGDGEGMASPIDSGTVSIIYENKALYLKLDSNEHGYIFEQLIPEVKKDYSKVDLSKYEGIYYSPSKYYQIELKKASDSQFYMILDYLNSEWTHDEGNVTPGESCTLNCYAIVTLDLKDDGTVRIHLTSAVHANGNFEEDLIKGKLVDTSGEEMKAFLIEQTFEYFKEKMETDYGITEMFFNSLKYHDATVEFDSATHTAKCTMYCDHSVDNTQFFGTNGTTYKVVAKYDVLSYTEVRLTSLKIS